MTEDSQTTLDSSSTSASVASTTSSQPNSSKTSDQSQIRTQVQANDSFNVKNLDFAVKKQTLRLDLRKIYSELFPKHDIDKLIMKELTEGAVNCMFKCYLVDQANKDVIIVRLFNFRMDTSQFSSDDKSLQNRDLEFESMCQASRLGICAKVFARFQNGIVYEFLPGQTVQMQQAHDIELGFKIAKQVARLHTLQIVNNRTKYSTQMQRMRLEAMPAFEAMFDDLQTKIEKSKVEEYKFLPRLRDINLDIQLIEERLEAIGVGDVAFCHNDLNLSNILYDSSTNQVKLLDFEWGEQNPTFVDIAVHFASFTGFFLQDYDNRLLPSEQYQRDWIRCYMIEFNQLKNRKQSESELNETIEEMLMKVAVYMQVVKLNFAIRAPIWDFKEGETQNPNKIALYCLKAVTGYRLDKERTESLLRKLEEKAGIKCDSKATQQN